MVLMLIIIAYHLLGVLGGFEWVIQYYSTMGIRAIELRSTPGNLLDFRRLRSSIWPVPPRRVLGFLKKIRGRISKTSLFSISF